MASQIKTCKENTLLMRQFLDKCLYQRHTGYFDSHPNLIQDHRDQTNDHALWFTPSTVSRPSYAQCMLTYIMQQVKNKNKSAFNPLVIYEIGAGTGAFASDVLSLLQKNHPNLYRNCEYHIVEKSSSLIQLQQTRLCDQHVHFHHGDILDASIKEDRPCFIFALEVLDNVPQDLIRFHQNQAWQGVIQFPDPNQCSYAKGIVPIQLQFEPVSDPLILQLISTLKQCQGFAFKSQQGAGVLPELGVSLLEHLWPFSLLDWRSLISCYHQEFIPTGIWSILSSIIYNKFQQGTMLISDFSSLPDTIPGHPGSPLVQAHCQQRAVSIKDIVHQPGTCDVMFPIDFDLLKQMILILGGRNVSISSNQTFVKERISCSPMSLFLNSFHNYSVLHFDF